jgi:hypothetical protein
MPKQTVLAEYDAHVMRMTASGFRVRRTPKKWLPAGCIQRAEIWNPYSGECDAVYSVWPATPAQADNNPLDKSPTSDTH